MNKPSVPSLDSLDASGFLVDAENQPLGRWPLEVASVCRGKKQNPPSRPHSTLVFVIMSNGHKIRIQWQQGPIREDHRRHSGRPGGMKTKTFCRSGPGCPSGMSRRRNQGQLPHNALGRQLFRKTQGLQGMTIPHGPTAQITDPRSFALRP